VGQAVNWVAEMVKPNRRSILAKRIREGRDNRTSNTAGQVNAIKPRCIFQLLDDKSKDMRGDLGSMLKYALSLVKA